MTNQRQDNLNNQAGRKDTDINTNRQRQNQTQRPDAQRSDVKRQER